MKVQMIPVTSFYAALLALLFVWLSVRTLRLRRSLRITIGDAGNPQMLRAMRVHSNFAEYVPLSLIALLLLEMQGTAAWLMHVLGVCLLFGRLSHAYGVGQSNETFQFRVTGMALTFTTLVAAALYLLSVAIIALVS
ncbi:MAG: MAPEG family protein [Burkholderiales bacterium]